MIRRDLAQDDEARFLEALGKADPELGLDPPPDPRHAFLEVPDGSPFLVRAEPSGATWAGRRRPVWLDGKRATFGELVPLAGPIAGPMAKTGAGTDPAAVRDEEAVLWSLTTPAQWERLELELGFELVRTPLKLVAQASEVRAEIASGIELSEADAFPEEVQALGQRLAAECGALAVRDKAFLDWRFGRKDRGYRIVLVRRGTSLIGCAVFRRGMFDGHPDQDLVVEWLVPKEEADAGRALRAALAQHAQREGIAQLAALLPEWTEEWMRFQDDGFHAEPTRYVLCARHRQRRHDAFWLFKRWYYTLADGGLA